MLRFPTASISDLEHQQESNAGGAKQRDHDHGEPETFRPSAWGEAAEPLTPERSIAAGMVRVVEHGSKACNCYAGQ